MSKWGKIRNSVRSVKAETLITASFESTCFIIPDRLRFADLLTDHQKDIWRINDFYDLARFCEDFVLCENVILSYGNLNLIAPYFADYFSDPESFPLKSSHKIGDGFSKFFYNYSIDHQGFLKYALDFQDSSTSKNNLYLQAVQEYLSVIKSDFLKTQVPLLIFDATISPVAKRLLDNAKKVKNKDDALLIKSIYLKICLSLNEILMNCFNVCQELCDFESLQLVKNDQFKKPIILSDMNYSMPIITSFFREKGFSISPGFDCMQTSNLESTKEPLSRFIYDPYEKKVKSKIEELSKYSAVSEIYTPPILSIIIQRCNSRKEFIYRLCELRSEFQKVRNSLSQIGAELKSKKTLGEKLKILNRIEIYRNELLRDIDQATKRTWIRRVWGIVKSLKPEKMAVELGNLLLDIDEHRKLIGSLRHFSKLDQLTKDINLNERKITLLYGKISR